MALATKYLSRLVLIVLLGLTFGSPDDERVTNQRQGHLTDLPKDSRRKLGSGLVKDNGQDTSHTQWEKKILEIPQDTGCIEDTDKTMASCYGDGVTEIPQNLSTTIEIITFGGTSIEKIPDDIFRNYTKLRQIVFGQNHLKEISPGAFRGLSNLTHLSFFENGLLDDSFGNETYDGLSSLKYFHLVKDELTKLPKYLLGGATNLEVLLIAETRINQTGLALISPLDKLTSLDLSYNQLSSLESSTFDQMANLKYLRLDSNHVATIKSGTFNGLNSLEYFEANWMKTTLTVQDNAFNRNLKSLDLSYNFNDHINISTSALLNLPALERILLSSCGLTYLDGAAFMYKPNLKKLDIYDNDFACDCHASWMLDAIVESKPWALDWGSNGTTRPPRCVLPYRPRTSDISELYPQDLTCDKPHIEAITPTFTHHDWNTDIILTARLTKGFPVSKWMFPDGSVWKDMGRSIGYVRDTIVDSDHSVITSCSVSEKLNMTGLLNFTLTATNVAGDSSLTFWVFKEPRPSNAVGRAAVSTVSLLLLMLLVHQG